MAAGVRADPRIPAVPRIVRRAAVIRILHILIDRVRVEAAARIVRTRFAAPLHTRAISHLAIHTVGSSDRRALEVISRG